MGCTFFKSPCIEITYFLWALTNYGHVMSRKVSYLKQAKLFSCKSFLNFCNPSSKFLINWFLIKQTCIPRLNAHLHKANIFPPKESSRFRPLKPDSTIYRHILKGIYSGRLNKHVLYITCLLQETLAHAHAHAIEEKLEFVARVTKYS